MYRSPFVARSRELEVLDTLWQSSRATLLILYGRRRVGKTRLLTHWLQQHQGEGLYWVAEPASELTQLRSFSQALVSFIDPDSPVPPDFTFSSWEMALRQVALYAQNRRLALIIDEVTYLIDVNASIVGVFQKAWDHWLSNTNLMLALCGSQMGLMKKHLLDYEAPFYGRATAQMQLPPMPFGATKLYFPQYDAAERVQIYAMWGGVPAYWERLDTTMSILQNLRQNILPAHAWMMDESRILLQDFLTDLHNYVGVLRAISDGQQALGEIAKRTGMTSSKTSFYMSVLRDTGFVERQVPITQRGTDSRRGRYFITDPYLRFFYRFLSAYQSKLALGQLQQIMQFINDELPGFIQSNTWVELCREWLLHASAHDAIPVPIEEVGSEWKRSFAVDVVGLSEAEKSFVLGDCYWNEEAIGVEAIKGLVEKTQSIVPRNGKWQVFYVLFSKSGFTEDAHAYAAQLGEESGRSRPRKKWHVAGLRLFDLAQVDEDLINWSV